MVDEHKPHISPDDSEGNDTAPSRTRRPSIISTSIHTISNALNVENKAITLAKEIKTQLPDTPIPDFTRDTWPEARWITLFPFMLVFVRGGLFIREAWRLYKNDHRYANITDPEERKLCLMTALAGGSVAMGGCIVNLLLQLQVGLLATAQATLLAPIILSSLGVGCYCMSIVRDVYRIQQATKKIKTATEEDTALLKKNINNLLYEMIFGAIGTFGTILAMSLSVVALTAGTAGLGTLTLLSSTLLAVSVIPTAIDLFSGLWSKTRDIVTPYMPKKPLTDLKKSPTNTPSQTPTVRHSHTKLFPPAPNTPSPSPDKTHTGPKKPGSYQA